MNKQIIDLATALQQMQQEEKVEGEYFIKVNGNPCEIKSVQPYKTGFAVSVLVDGNIQEKKIKDNKQVCFVPKQEEQEEQVESEVEKIVRINTFELLGVIKVLEDLPDPEAKDMLGKVACWQSEAQSLIAKKLTNAMSDKAKTKRTKNHADKNKQILASLEEKQAKLLACNSNFAKAAEEMGVGAGAFRRDVRGYRFMVMEQLEERFTKGELTWTNIRSAAVIWAEKEPLTIPIARKVALGELDYDRANQQKKALKNA